MTPDQVRLVRESWAKVKPIAPDAASLFYGRLFEIDPSIRPLFKRDIDRQGLMLMDTMDMVVARLDDLGDLVPEVRELGARHATYGVRDEHYIPVGAALLWTLEHYLGDAFTSAVRGAWASAYGILAGTMMEAARIPRAA
jgi:hemoglobin-like flavoprotein